MEMSKRPASMAIVKQELQNLIAQQTPRSQSKTQAPVKRRRFLVVLVSTVATCAITTYLMQNPNLLDVLFAHPFSGTTPVLSPAHLVPEQATILSRSLYTYHGHKGTVTAVAWSPDDKKIASSGTLDSSVQVWDAYTGKLVLISHSHEKDLAIFATTLNRVDALAWSPDSTQIAAALGNDTVGVWSIEKVDKKLFPFTTMTGISNALAWSPDRSMIAVVTWNIFVQVCSATTGKLSDTYPGNTQAVLTLAWSPDGKHIASGGADGTVQVWSATTGQSSLTYSGHFASVYAVSWSPDSKQIASGGADGTVQVWDAATGRTLFTYRGHSGGVNSVAWQRGPLLSAGIEARIASGGADATVQVWSFGMIGDTKNMLAMALQGELLIYRGHSGPVTSVAWALDGQHIASGSEDGTVQVWQAM